MDAYSLGQYLREAREAKEIEIEDVVAKLRIRQPILESFRGGRIRSPRRARDSDTRAAADLRALSGPGRRPCPAAL